ncbi:DJ-1 family glyoxalase III [Streptococcus oricebi]|uniref:DJ-1 family protein n=1 Tax=Streptococcus oricebi TaxID=1547447 RepID=A0ABS5B1G6_9STRE|nr:DJ-1 family glyoxalase III [Streptococcus oricebi]MBP2622521.1 DJ-1 family protein [Streptococcus oricebi]
MKVALILANGFEEIEALTVVDVLRRANIDCQILGFEAEPIGSHAISVKADQIWTGDLTGYDMVVLPGGMPGSENLSKDPRLLIALKQMSKEQKWIAAICAAPLVLDAAGLLEGKNFTCYDGVENRIASGSYQKETVVVDGKIITSRGPATSLAFAYELVKQLGGPDQDLAKAMLYQDVFGY